MRIVATSWNLAGKLEHVKAGDLVQLLKTQSKKQPDLLILGFQEIIELNPQNVLLGDSEDARQTFLNERAVGCYCEDFFGAPLGEDLGIGDRVIVGINMDRVHSY